MQRNRPTIKAQVRIALTAELLQFRELTTLDGVAIFGGTRLPRARRASVACIASDDTKGPACLVVFG